MPADDGPASHHGHRSCGGRRRLGLVIASVGIVDTQRRLLLRGLDDTLAQRADDLTTLFSAGAVPDPLASRGGEDSVAQLVTPQGEVVAASDRLRGAGPIATLVASDPQPRTILLSLDEEPFRVLPRRTTRALEWCWTCRVARSAADPREPPFGSGDKAGGGHERILKLCHGGRGPVAGQRAVWLPQTQNQGVPGHQSLLAGSQPTGV